MSSNIQDNLNSVTNSNQILSGNTDKMRTMFLKGLKSTSSGQKEDPTYTGFRIMFDMGYGGVVDPETFLPISPLFSPGSSSIDPSLPKGMTLGHPTDFFHGSRQKMYPFPNYTEQMHYMTAEGFLRERRSDAENSVNPIIDATGKTIAIDPTQKNSSGYVSYRANALLGFKALLTAINQNSPWFIQSIDGLDKILQVTPPRQVGGSIGKYKEQRSGILTLECMDSIDLRVNAMAELYRKATYDYAFHREILPANLRKFRMYIIVTEIRQINLQNDLSNILNPFNISGVSNAVSSISNIAQSAGLFGNGGNPSNVSADSNTTENNVNQLINNLVPYILIYELNLCEFNFDESYAFSKLTNTKGEVPVSNKFKIHVGSAKEYKLQYNIVSDLIQNSSSLTPLLIQDSWNLMGSSINTATNPNTIDNNSNLFTTLANNFINNSVSSVVQQQISPIVTKSLLGNAYGSGLTRTINQATSSIQGLYSALQNISNPLSNAEPQNNGYGGPPQRQYPTINTDVYSSRVQPNSNIPGGSVYSNNPNNTISNITDVYPNQNTSLGLPNRVYPNVNDDEYSADPGIDLGVPNRVYPLINTDVYPDQNTSLGLPARMYTNVKEDEYPTDPGNDLGVPNRVYPLINTDVYPDQKTSLGLPNRVYPKVADDEYSTDPGIDLGVPNRVYPLINTDVYPDQNISLGLPDRTYSSIKDDEYRTTPGKDLGVPERIYSTINTDVYNSISNTPNIVISQESIFDKPNKTPDIIIPDVYSKNIQDQTKEIILPGSILDSHSSVKNSFPIDNINPKNYQEDLGLPKRIYPTIVQNVYNNKL